MLTHPIFTNYLITENGDVINKKTGRMIKSSDNGTGYLQVCLRKDKKSHFRLINRLVMETYDPIENQHLYHAHHNNEIRDDNRLENLKWELKAEHLRKHQKGKVVGEETRRKMSEAKKGRVLTEEHRRKIGESMKGKKRKPFSEETRQKISEAHKGHLVSDETKKKLSASHKGVKKSEETRRKMSEAQKKRGSIPPSQKGMLFWNDGVKNIRSKECPGEGWTRGMCLEKMC
jgi:hypothetical protein